MKVRTVVRWSCLALVALAACVQDVPATPTYQDDVRPILLANCVRCHTPGVDGGVPLPGGAKVPTDFRLDRWESTGTCPPTPDASVDGGADPCILGVQAKAERIVIRAADEGTMPPTGPSATASARPSGAGSAPAGPDQRGAPSAASRVPRWRSRDRPSRRGCGHAPGRQGEVLADHGCCGTNSSASTWPVYAICTGR